MPGGGSLSRNNIRLPLRGYADWLSWNPLRALKLLGAPRIRDFAIVPGSPQGPLHRSTEPRRIRSFQGVLIEYPLWHINAGWSSQVAREAHNLEVVGSNPAPAT